MTDKPCFATAPSWRAARALLAFEPLVLRRAAGRPLRSLRVHVRDHRRRELELIDRSLGSVAPCRVAQQGSSGSDLCNTLKSKYVLP